MANGDADPGFSRREKIALGVIIISGVGIALVSTVAIGAGIYFSAAEDPRRTFVMGIFNTLIPLFGTWVGTVIAFYFSRENFATAAQATRELVSQLGDDRLRQISVKDAWIEAAAIEAVPIPTNKTENDIVFDDVRKKLSTKVTRVPVWNADKVIRYIIHESMIYKYLADQSAAKANATLQDFLDYNDMKSIVTKIAYVSQDSTLADAKAKMTSVPGCQDVIVTATGQKTEPVLGWITNAAIAAKAKT
ncbi:MAG: hypothetical protein ACHQ9S_08490 [Candidatus Binatia bacterium]